MRLVQRVGGATTLSGQVGLRLLNDLLRSGLLEAVVGSLIFGARESGHAGLLRGQLGLGLAIQHDRVHLIGEAPHVLVALLIPAKLPLQI